MSLKIVLVQVTDLNKIFDVLYDVAGLGGSGETPVVPRKDYMDHYMRSELPANAPYPIGILALAAYARKKFKKKVDIVVIDMLQQRIGVKELMKRIEKHSPDIVGLSAFSSFSSALHEIAAKVKKMDPGCKVLAGGPYCTASKERAAADKNIDLVAYGEGELTFEEAVKRTLSKRSLKGIAGTAYLDRNKVKIEPPQKLIEDISSLPFPAVDLIDVKGYFGHLSPLGRPAPYMILFNSRGCPYRCIFCHNIFGKNVRFMSCERTFEEIRFYHDKYGIKEFHIWDDIFNLDVKRGIELCGMIASLGPGLRLYFMGGLRADIMKRELLEAMIKAGTCYICYAVESGSPRVQRLIRKDLNLKKAGEAIDFTSDAGIWVNTYNMIGFPTETKDEVLSTIDYNIAHRGHSIRLFKVIPQEGTALYEMTEAGKAKSDGETDMYLQYGAIEDGNISAEELKQAISDGRLRYYLDPKRVDRIINMKSSVLDRSEIYKAYFLEILPLILGPGKERIKGLSPKLKGQLNIILSQGGYGEVARALGLL